MSDGHARTLLGLGLASVGYFALALVVLHVLNWDELAEHGRHVSNFAWMRGAWLWQSGLVGLGAGLLFTVEGLRRSLPITGPPAWSFWALRVAGLAILAMVVFRTDRYASPDLNYSVSGYVHDSCAVLSTFLICWSMLLMVAAARVDPAWRGIPSTSWGVPLGTIALSLAWMGGDVTEYWPIAAVVQRAVVVTMTAWLLTVGWRALSTQASAAGTPQPTPPPRPTR